MALSLSLGLSNLIYPIFRRQAKNLVPKSRVVDADRDGVADSHDGVGCLVLPRAPRRERRLCGE
jgi:hypothetical protein